MKHSREDKKALRRNDMRAVKSSFISAVGKRDEHLVIRFRNGSIYLYYNASALYDKFLKASSKGRYFWKHIRRPDLPFVKGGSMPLPSDLKVTDKELLDTLQDDILDGMFKAVVKYTVTTRILTDPDTGKKVKQYIVGGRVINQTVLEN